MSLDSLQSARNLQGDVINIALVDIAWRCLVDATLRKRISIQSTRLYFSLEVAYTRKETDNLLPLNYRGRLLDKDFIFIPVHMRFGFTNTYTEVRVHVPLALATCLLCLRANGISSSTVPVGSSNIGA